MPTGTAMSTAWRICSGSVLGGGTSTGTNRPIWMSSDGSTFGSCRWVAGSEPTVGLALVGVPMTGSQPYLGKKTSGKLAPFLGRTSSLFGASLSCAFAPATSPPSKP